MQTGLSSAPRSQCGNRAVVLVHGSTAHRCHSLLATLLATYRHHPVHNTVPLRCPITATCALSGMQSVGYLLPVTMVLTHSVSPDCRGSLCHSPPLTLSCFALGHVSLPEFAHGLHFSRIRPVLTDDQVSLIFKLLMDHDHLVRYPKVERALSFEPVGLGESTPRLTSCCPRPCSHIYVPCSLPVSLAPATGTSHCAVGNL